MTHNSKLKNILIPIITLIKLTEQTDKFTNYEDCYNVACSACGQGYDKLAS